MGSPEPLTITNLNDWPYGYSHAHWKMPRAHGSGPMTASVFQALSATGQAEPEKAAETPAPAVPIKKSVQHDFIICLEDGKKMKMLKRHLATSYSMTPEDYRRRWGLPKDYPMVAPAYTAQRSALALKIGLGRKPAAAVAPEPVAVKAPPRHVAGGRKPA